jgi:hypothetical protein
MEIGTDLTWVHTGLDKAFRPKQTLNRVVQWS